MAWKITGQSLSGSGPERELYVIGTTSEAVARNMAAREQLISRSVEHVGDSDIPYDSWLVAAPRPRRARVTGTKHALEELGNSDLMRRPVRTLALGVGLGVFGGMVLFMVFWMVFALLFGGIRIV